MYVFAGYLPPGLQDIFIYDRQNDMLYGKQVIIEPNTADHGLDAGDWYRADQNLYDKTVMNWVNQWLTAWFTSANERHGLHVRVQNDRLVVCSHRLKIHLVE